MPWTNQRDREPVLTEVECEVSILQEGRNCLSCRHLEYQERSCAKLCNSGGNVKATLCRRKPCDYWERAYAKA